MVDGVVGLRAVYLFRQPACDVVARAASYDFVSIVCRQIVRAEVKHFRHIDAVVVFQPESPFHVVTLLLVPSGNFAECNVRVNGRSPFLLFGVAVHVNESDVHHISTLIEDGEIPLRVKKSPTDDGRADFFCIRVGNQISCPAAHHHPL